ncbi:hypothetical protein BESB_021890 [Besnoitia besnoiti]|uniref:Uncharacterized protein n=1 Tax=Besnoitia besnoiti TaxID=94643 RepID=A0A2A9M120_BESBE|nr:hypothetical protein BESB_021890 [Besnoitia besnoiti]PFH32248.1 hypothetical protein BESB_021890 [Besnoitia besnoiti]
MVYGIVIFTAQGSVPLFSSFFTPEGNDDQMQNREQAVMRRVVEDRLFQVQCARDVILACAPSPSSPTGAAASAGASFSFSRYERKKAAGAGAPGARSGADAACRSPANEAPGAAGKPGESESSFGGGGGGAVGAAATGNRAFRASNAGRAATAGNEKDRETASGGAAGAEAEAAAKRRAAASAAAAEVMEGVFLLQQASLFAAPKVVVWKHVESISYALICTALDNVLLGANFLTLFIHCLADSFASDKVASTQGSFAQQLLSHPDIILLVLHFLLPGGQLIFINGNQAKFLKNKIKAAMEQKSN